MSIRNTAVKNSPNLHLQAERVKRQWTQQNVADHIGTTVVNVSRWERGVTVPGPYFREQLCTLFDKEAADLGLLPKVASLNESEALAESEVCPVIEEATPLNPPEEQAVYQHKDGSPPKRHLNIAFALGLITILILAVSMRFAIMPQHLTHAFSNKSSTRTNIAQPALIYSFEDGTIDGWVKTGNILSMENSSEVGGYEGTHALKVIFSSRDSTDLPYISVNPSRDQPVSGQLLSAALFLSKGTTATITAKLYVQDSTYAWHSSPWATLAGGKWNMLTYPIPAFSGPALQVGLQFFSWPANTRTIVSIDAIAWR